MLRLRAILCSLVALCLTGIALAVPQVRDSAAAPAARPGAKPGQDRGAPAPDAINMDDLLRLWEGQSAKLRTLEVEIYRIDKNPAWWDEEEHYLGHAAFEAPQLAYLDFRKVKLQPQADPNDQNKKHLVPVKKNGKIDSTPYQTIVCTGAEVWDYHYDAKQIFIYTLDRDARKRALEEGPLPFLFNMRADDARQRYVMALHSQNEKRFLVKIKPLFQEEKERFSYAWISLDRDFLLPTRIVLIAPDGKSSQDFHLSHPKANLKVNEAFFAVRNPGKPWKVERNPGARGPANPASAKAPRRPVPRQSAQRGGDPGDERPR
jgi:TIGR03009 family protein